VSAQSFWVETLGCPKNAVDSDKVVASLLADGLVPAADAADADLVVVNTCAFIDAARQESIEAEARSLVDAGVAELVLVAQDLAWYGRDAGEPGALAPLLRRLDPRAADGLVRVRLLYLYPSEVRDPLVSTMLELPTVVPYFDLSLQHADARLLRRMKRWGSGDRFLAAIDAIRAEEPDTAFRSSFIVGFPGEREREHDELLEFLAAASLDWAGFFPFSPEDGTPAASLPDAVDRDLALEWLRECEAVQEPITRAARDALVGREIEVLVDARDDEGMLTGRTHREAPEIDGVVQLQAEFARPGAIVRAHVTEAIGPDLLAKAAGAEARG
jgi:ribosomal protein S12 methylthiotransferase